MKHIVMQTHQYGAGKRMAGWIQQKATCRWLMQGQLSRFCSQTFLGRGTEVSTHGLSACLFFHLSLHPWEVNGAKPSGWVSLCLLWRHAQGYWWKILPFLPKPSQREFMRHDMQTLPCERINQFSETGSGKGGPSWNKSHWEYDCWLNWDFAQ